jgi:hypothetical protein
MVFKCVWTCRRKEGMNEICWNEITRSHGAASQKTVIFKIVQVFVCVLQANIK